MKQKTLKSIINAFKTASTDFARYHLTHVRLEVGEASCKIVACDGHRLSIVTEENDDDDSLLRGVFYFSRESLPVLKALAKNKIIITEVNSEIMTLSMDSLRVSSVKIDNYPNYDQVIPKSDDVVYTVGLNAEILAGLVESLGAYEKDKKAPHVKLTFRGTKHSPVVVECGPNSFGVIMPVRI